MFKVGQRVRVRSKEEVEKTFAENRGTKTPCIMSSKGTALYFVSRMERFFDEPGVIKLIIKEDQYLISSDNGFYTWHGSWLRLEKIDNREVRA